MSEIITIKVFKFYDELVITMVGYMKTGQVKGLYLDGTIDGKSNLKTSDLRSSHPIFLADFNSCSCNVSVP